MISFRTNHSSSKLNISSHGQPVESDGEIDDDDSINIYSKGINPILFENDEGMSDDDQVCLPTLTFNEAVDIERKTCSFHDE